MPKSQSQKFSLYFWLIKKLRRELIIWYFFTFLSSFFYYQAIFSLKMWSRKEPPYSLFFGTTNINSRSNLLWCAFGCFFIGNLLTSLICDYWKNYILELCRTYLRKLLIDFSAKNPQKTQLYQKEILGNFLGEVELFVPLFILIPQRIYAALVSIILNLVFLTDFKENKFAIRFVLFVSLILAILSFLAYWVQKKINQQQNNFRYQENLMIEKYLENPSEPQKIKELINFNLRKTRRSLKKKTLSYLPTLIIPGLNILFCFIYSQVKYGGNWGIKQFADTYLISTSIQTIFWKVKDITDNSLEISKIKVHHKSLLKTLNKLQKNNKYG